MSDTQTDIDTLVADLEQWLAKARNVQASPRVAANPDGTPGFVAAGELIESAWGNATANTIQNLLLPNQIEATAHAIGKFNLKTQTVTVGTNPGGNAQLGFPTGTAAFLNPPTVLITPVNAPAANLVIGVWGTTTLATNLYVTTAAGTVYANQSITVSYLAIARR